MKVNVQLELAYAAACVFPSDIHEHLPVLRTYASKCSHITEMGTHTGQSTLAFLAAQPDGLICYDITEIAKQTVDHLQTMAGSTRLLYHMQSTLDAEIAPTDLLFIDTYHTYQQLKIELQLHASKARRWIILHDTETFGLVGEGGHDGLLRAMNEWLASCEWVVEQQLPNNNGLTILRRK